MVRPDRLTTTRGLPALGPGSGLALIPAWSGGLALAVRGLCGVNGEDSALLGTVQQCYGWDRKSLGRRAVRLPFSSFEGDPAGLSRVSCGVFLVPMYSASAAAARCSSVARAFL